jgi:hypothetical protein
MTADSSQAAQDDTGRSGLMGSTNDLADDAPRSRLDQVLQWVPRILSSKPHVIALVALGVYLIVLPLLGVMVSAKAELIGGNYTNVTSDIAASIAAGGTLHLVNQGRKRRQMDEERLRLARETHQLLHQVYGDAARQLGHITGAAGPGAGTADRIRRAGQGGPQRRDRRVIPTERLAAWRREDWATGSGPGVRAARHRPGAARNDAGAESE